MLAGEVKYDSSFLLFTEEIPFEIGNLNNVLSQLPPDAFNELLFSGRFR